MRHAKSSWDDPTLSDHDRPLAPRGRRAAQRMAQHLDSEDVHPDLVLCSSALRARETLEPLLPTLSGRAAVHVENDLYGADADHLLARLRAVAPPISSVLLVGHNPSLQLLALSLAGRGSDLAMEQLQTKFPTGALATLALGSTKWSRLAPGRAFLKQLLLPRQLPGSQHDHHA
jgi:phosphohistidine phosphatase